MLKKLFVLGLSLVFVVACSSKKKADDAGTAGDGMNSAADIAEKPIIFDPLGSDSGNISGLRTVNFAYDSQNLDAEAKQVLGSNAEWMKSNPNAKMQIEGHCDSRGSNEYNLTLGERRANTVKTYLQGQGVDAARLSVISYGEEKPLATGENDADYAKNRRANFVPVQ
jgi:peptidoglycan-associated lipoprotein